MKRSEGLNETQSCVVGGSPPRLCKYVLSWKFWILRSMLDRYPHFINLQISLILRYIRYIVKTKNVLISFDGLQNCAICFFMTSAFQKAKNDQNLKVGQNKDLICTRKKYSFRLCLRTQAVSIKARF